jgi:hypothetical protein
LLADVLRWGQGSSGLATDLKVVLSTVEATRDDRSPSLRGRMNARDPTGAGRMATMLALMAACAAQEDRLDGNGIPIGLLLSFSGHLASNSVNSERAVTMAIEAANAAGGVNGRAFALISRNTRSDVRLVPDRAQDLLDAGAAVIIGPDDEELARALLPQERTIILPGLSAVGGSPPWWFVIGASAPRFACEIMAQLSADDRRRPLLIVKPSGPNVSLAWALSVIYGLPRAVLSGELLTSDELEVILREKADAYVVAALPGAASSLVHAMTARGALKDPRQWFLSPTLHTPTFLESGLTRALRGARGVSAGTAPGTADFSVSFAERWQDAPLDDAYPFYDAGAVAVLALSRSLARTGAIPGGTGLSEHVVAVTRSGGHPVLWNELPRGLELLREGREVEYVALSGVIRIDSPRNAPALPMRWWTIGEHGFEDLALQSDCN